MNSVFSWQNSVSLCSASFCTPRPNLLVTPGIFWFPTFVFQFHHEKEIFCVRRCGFSGGSAGKESAWNVGDLYSIPGLGRFPGEGNSYPLLYSGLENSMNSIVHGVTKSWTWLSDFNTHTHMKCHTLWSIVGLHRTWSTSAYSASVVGA